MSEPLAVQLARLAPAVDLAASRELFERHRGEAFGDPGRPDIVDTCRTSDGDSS